MKIFISNQYFFLCFLVVSALGLQSCNLYYNVFFKTEKSINTEAFESTSTSAFKQYKIERGDYLAIAVYTDKGEILIDPNREYELGTENSKTIISTMGGTNNSGGGAPLNSVAALEYANLPSNMPLGSNNMLPRSYLVDEHGEVELPVIGKQQVVGLSLGEASEKFKKSFSSIYKEPFIVTQYLNKRVIVMGGLGDKVIPLRNENMTLIEILALVGNTTNARIKNIRLIRGDLKNPSVQLIDLSTIEGMQKANLVMMSGDIIYVEPRRRRDPQSNNDITLGVSSVSSLLTIYLILNQLFK